MVSHPEAPCRDCPLLKLQSTEAQEVYFSLANLLISRLELLSISRRRKGILNFRQTFEGEIAKGHEGARLAGRCALRRLVKRDCEFAVPPPAKNT